MDFADTHRACVGASLLAIAECQAVSVLAVLARSRASPLPQWFLGAHGFCRHLLNLLAMALSESFFGQIGQCQGQGRLLGSVLEFSQ